MAERVVVQRGRGKVSPCWKGDNIKYRAAHRRIWAARGRADQHGCFFCPNQAYGWSWRHDAAKMLVSPSGAPYSPDPDDYIPTCPSCAMHYDNARFDLFGVRTNILSGWEHQRRIGQTHARIR